MSSQQVPPRAPAVRPEIWVVLASVGGSFLVYLPFLGRMETVYRFWDGPNYLTVARTLYAVRPDNPLLRYVQTPTYFLTHLPLYPLLVRAFSFFGYQPALLVVEQAEIHAIRQCDGASCQTLETFCRDRTWARGGPAPR